jgi:hypothetical protein
MINGSHVIIYSKDAEADRVFLRDVLKLSHVDVGHGWLIFALPPSEIAVHPADNNGNVELYFMCEDVDRFVGEMTTRGVVCTDVQDLRWGRLTNVTLPSGSRVGVYEPKHERP